MSYDGATVSGISCIIEPDSKTELLYGNIYGQIMVDVCEQTSPMASVRARLAKNSAPLSEGCDEGPLKVAQLRSTVLKKVQAVECAHIFAARCRLLSRDLKYYQRILAGVPYGTD